MANDNGNGLPPELAQVQIAPVNQQIVQALQTALDKARRGEINALLMCGAKGSDLSTFDTIVIDNMALALMTVGAAQVAITKIVKGAWDAQQPAPMSRIVRAGPGMPVG